MTDQLALTRAPRTSLIPNPNRAVRQQIPAFLNKLYAMVNDPETDELIRWSDEGDSFLVPNHERFGRELLPRFFKHGNFASFVRQLNMYGFHKVPHLQQGVLQNETETELWQFVSPHFQRGQPDLLMLIQRKKSHNNAVAGAIAEGEGISAPAGPSGANAAAAGSDTRALDISNIAQTLSAIKRHQTAISSDLKELQQSNTALWQEAVAARERHKKHQDTINRILKFLAGVFGNAAGPGAHGGTVRDHDEDHPTASAPNGAADSPSPGALIPRKRPRLMIEQSGSGSDVVEKGKGSAPLTRAQVEELEDEAWADEHILVPMETDDIAPTPSEIKSPAMAKGDWRETTTSSAKIESVASTPAAIPATPGPMPTSPSANATSHRTATRSADASLSVPTTTEVPPNTASTNYFPTSALPTTQTSVIAPNQVYPYTSQSIAPTTTPQMTSAAPSGDLSAADQATLNALLNSPSGFQRLLASMSQPGGLPVLPQMDASTMQPMQYQYPNMGFAAAPPATFNPGVPAVPVNANAGQLMAHPNTFNYPSQHPAAPYHNTSASQDTNLTPDALLSLLNVQGNAPGGYSQADLDLANNLHAYTNTLNRTYTDADAISADVDALQQSINSLMETIGLDPNALATVPDNSNLPHPGQELAPSHDINSMLDFSHDSLHPTEDSVYALPDFNTVSGHQRVASREGPFMDEVNTVGTLSSRSSPALDTKTETGSTKPSTRSAKRKSEATDLEMTAADDPAVVIATKPRKSNRKK